MRTRVDEWRYSGTSFLGQRVSQRFSYFSHHREVIVDSEVEGFFSYLLGEFAIDAIVANL